MKTNKELLSSVLKTTQMGQIGIRSALEYPVSPKLREEMESQLREYDAIETEAHNIAQNRQWKLEETNQSARYFADRMTRMKLAYGNLDSKTAAMMIYGNTNGIIKGCKNRNHLCEMDMDVCALTDKLIAAEIANIQKMEPFL